MGWDGMHEQEERETTTVGNGRGVRGERKGEQKLKYLKTVSIIIWHCVCIIPGDRY